MNQEEYYYELVNNIYKAKTPYEILSNVDNLNYINEKNLYKRKRLFKNGIKKL